MMQAVQRDDIDAALLAVVGKFQYVDTAGRVELFFDIHSDPRCVVSSVQKQIFGVAVQWCLVTQCVEHGQGGSPELLFRKLNFLCATKVAGLPVDKLVQPLLVSTRTG